MACFAHKQVFSTEHSGWPTACLFLSHEAGWFLLQACHLGHQLQHQALAMVKHTPALAKVEPRPCLQAQVMLRIP